MIKILISIFILALFSACSFKSQPNEWKYKSINAFASYTNNFLSNRDDLAKSDLKRAITHAKQSADLTQLSRIYLGKCALNISVGIADECSEYRDMSSLIKDKSLRSYYAFVSSSININEIEPLEAKYKDFARNVLKRNYEDAKENMFNMDKITSKLLSASLIKDQLSLDDVTTLIKDASFYGYKKSVIFWLKVKKEKTTTEIQKQEIDKKIKILG